MLRERSQRCGERSASVGRAVNEGGQIKVVDEAFEWLSVGKHDVSIADVAVQDARFVREMMAYSVEFKMSGCMLIDLHTLNSITDTRDEVPRTPQVFELFADRVDHKAHKRPLTSLRVSDRTQRCTRGPMERRHTAPCQRAVVDAAHEARDAEEWIPQVRVVLHDAFVEDFLIDVVDLPPGLLEDVPFPTLIATPYRLPDACPSGPDRVVHRPPPQGE